MTLVQQVRDLNRSVSLDSAALDFTRYAKSMLATKGDSSEALALASARGASSRLREMFETPVDYVKVRDEMMMKAPINVGSIDGSTWGSALAPFMEASTAFITSLAPFSAFDRILSDGGFTRMPLRTRIAIASSAAIGHELSELAMRLYLNYRHSDGTAYTDPPLAMDPQVNGTWAATFDTAVCETGPAFASIRGHDPACADDLQFAIVANLANPAP